MPNFKNNVRKYFHILENLTANYYFDNYMSSVVYTENSDGTMELNIVIPNELVCTNLASRFTNNELFSSGKLLTSATLITITDKSSEIIVNSNTSSPFINKITDTKYYSINPITPIKRKELINPTKLAINKKSYIKNIINKTQLYNLFKINDLIRVKSFIFGEGERTTNMDGGLPYEIIRDFYITNIVVNDSTFEIKAKSVDSQLYKIPITITTRSFTNMLDFLKAYIFPYIFKYTNVDEILLTSRDFNTLKNSNIGRYRLPVGNFGLFLKKISQDYNINFLWGGIYGNNSSTVKGTKCVCFFGNSYLPPSKLPFSGDFVAGRVELGVFQYQNIIQNSIKRIDDDSNPVLIRVTSVNEQLENVKNKDNNKVEILWGDTTANLASALGDSSGNVVNITTNIALGREGMIEMAKKQYIKIKYLGNFNSFSSKEPVVIRELIYYTDEKPVNNGFYFITKLSHTFDENGYVCNFETSTKMSILDNLKSILQ